MYGQIHGGNGCSFGLEKDLNGGRERESNVGSDSCGSWRPGWTAGATIIQFERLEILNIHYGSPDPLALTWENA